MKVTVKPIQTGTFGNVSHEFTCSHSHSCGKPSGHANLKDSQIIIIIIIIIINNDKNRDTYEQIPNTLTETLNTEKTKTCYQKEVFSNIGRNTTQPNTANILAQEEKIKVDIMERIMFEKETALPSLRMED